MTRKTPFSQLTRIALACVLTAGLIPAIAYADEASPESSVVDQFAAKSAEAVSRYDATGNADDLRDVTEYESDDGIMALSNGSLPTLYDLRDKGVVTPVKFQNPWGTCWSFGAIAACETSIMSELGWSIDAGQEVNLSELHVAWFAYTALPDDAGSQAGEGRHSTNQDPDTVLNKGGMLYTVTSVLSSGIGPVLESDAPYKNKQGDIQYKNEKPYCYARTGDWSVDESLRFAQTIELEESAVLPSPASKDESGAYRYNPAGTNAIKQELLAGRAVVVGFTADASRPDQTDPAKYINTDTWAHYTYDENVEANHAVTIVGWDDNYSKENFLADHRPENNGAWIVKNSWGSSAEEFPNKNAWGENGEGFFHLSYEDKSLELPESFNFYTKNYGQRADYYLIDQYDYLPSDGVTSAQKATEASMANVFQAEEGQVVRSLSCETAKPGTKVTYQLYRLGDGFANPRDGELLTTVTETYEFGGYHRIELGDGFPMEEGQHFSVVETQQCGDAYEVLTDRATNKNGMKEGAEIYSVGVVNPGESYVYENGTWSDWSDDVKAIKAKAAESGADIFDYDNFAIKAYSDPMSEPPIYEPTAVPDLTGLTEAEALSTLEQMGLQGEAGTAEYSDTVEAGRVVRQGTAAGTEVDRGYIVTYFLSLGKDPATVAPVVPESTDPTDDAKPLASTSDATPAAALATAATAALAVCLAAARKRKRRAPPVILSGGAQR